MDELDNFLSQDDSTGNELDSFLGGADTSGNELDTFLGGSSDGDELDGLLNQQSAPDIQTQSGQFPTVSQALKFYQDEAGEDADPKDFISTYTRLYNNELKKDEGLNDFQRQARVAALRKKAFSSVTTLADISTNLRQQQVNANDGTAQAAQAEEENPGLLSRVGGFFGELGTSFLRSGAADNEQQAVSPVLSGDIDEDTAQNIADALLRSQELGVNEGLARIVDENNTLGDIGKELAGQNFGLILNVLAQNSIDLAEEAGTQLGVTVGQGFVGGLLAVAPEPVTTAVGAGLVTTAPASGSAAGAAVARENAQNTYFAGQISQYLADNNLPISAESVQTFLNDTEAVQIATAKSNRFANVIAGASFTAGLVGGGQVTALLGKTLGRTGAELVVEGGEVVIREVTRGTSRQIITQRVAEGAGAAVIETGGEVIASLSVGDQVTAGEIALELVVGVAEGGVDVGVGGISRRIRANRESGQANQINKTIRDRVDELRESGATDEQISEALKDSVGGLVPNASTEDIDTLVENVLSPETQVVDNTGETDPNVPRGTVETTNDTVEDITLETGADGESIVTSTETNVEIVDTTGQSVTNNVVDAQGISRVSDVTQTDPGLVTRLRERASEITEGVRRAIKSDAGLSKEVGAAVRQINRDRAVYNDRNDTIVSAALASLRRAGRKLTKANRDSLNQEAANYLSGESTGANISEDVKITLDALRANIDSNTLDIQTRLSEKILFDAQTRLNQDQLSRLRDSINGQDLDDDIIAALPEGVVRNVNVIQTLGRNKGKYLTRAYKIFNNPAFEKSIKKSTSYQTAITEEARVLAAARGDATPTADDRRNAKFNIDTLLRDAAGSIDSLEYLTSASFSNNILRTRKDIPEHIRRVLGEETAPISVAANTLSKQAGLIINIDHSRRVRDTLLEAGLASENRDTAAQNGHIDSFSDNVNTGYLDGLFVDPDVKASIESVQELQPVQDRMLRNLVSFVGLAKVNNTLLSATTTARNFMNGYFLAIRTGNETLFTNRGEFTKAARLAWDTVNNRSERERLIRLGVIGDGLRSQDTRLLLRDALDSPSFAADLLFGKNNGQDISFRQKALKFFSQTYSFGDDVWRLMVFNKERDRLIEDFGVDPTVATDEAAITLSRLFPTYSALPRGIRQLRRIPVVGTFVSFPWEMVRTAKNIALQIREDSSNGRRSLAAKRLAGLAISASAGLAVRAAALEFLLPDEVNGDEVDKEEYQAALKHFSAPWQQNSTIATLGTNENGEPITIDLSAFFPDEMFVRIARAAFKGEDSDDQIANVLKETLTPYFSTDIATKGLIEVVANRDQFGRPIRIEQQPGRFDPDVFKENSFKTLAHLATDGGALPATVSRNLRGIIRSSDDYLAEIEKANQGNVTADIAGDLRALAGPKRSLSGKVFSTSNELAALAGFRIGTTSIPTALNYRASAYSAELRQDIRAEFNRSIKQNTFISDDRLRDTVQRLVDRTDAVYATASEDIRFARAANFSDKQIKSSYPKNVRNLLSAIVDGNDPGVKGVGDKFIKDSIEAFRARVQDEERVGEYRLVLIERQTKVNQIINELSQ